MREVRSEQRKSRIQIVVTLDEHVAEVMDNTDSIRVETVD